ncbi:MAG: hypothetical protein JW709_03135 [Sedimentisphaerales bacterium]|nr:hypothetical protein [Sedimentisphaerales bacterium]
MASSLFRVGKHIFTAGILVLGMGISAAGQTRLDIDPIRTKQGPLAPGDDQRIIGFVGTQLNKMATSVSVKNLNDLFEALVEARLSTAPPESPAATGYREAFAQGVKQNWRKAMSTAAANTDASLAQMIQADIAIIVALTDHPILIEDLLVLLKDSAPRIRYWGAKGLYESTIRQYLLATPDELATVQAALSGAMETETDSEVIAQIAQAGGIPNKEGISLLIKCAETQRKAYQQWSLTCNEYSDTIVLQQMTLLAANPELAKAPLTEQTPKLIKAAAELYAAALYRYIKGVLYVTEKGEPISLLPQQNELQLQTLLIEIEWEFMQISQSSRRSRMAAALQKPPQLIRADLESSFEALLGLEGDVNRAFSIYRSGEDYQSLLILIPDPPARLVNRAQALQNLIIYEEKRESPRTPTPGMMPAPATRPRR